MATATNVRVVCRFRPLNAKETEMGGGHVVSNLARGDGQDTVTVKGSEIGTHSFTFDRVFTGDAKQADVYHDAALPVVQDILNGYNGTIFVYGQTSSGKTFTMQGPSIDDENLKGIIPRMNNTIFDFVRKADSKMEFLVKASYIEIYMEHIRDLLDHTKQNLKVREEKMKGIWVEDATEVYVSNESDVLDVIRTGSTNRAIAETKMNAESSRSHSIFILTVIQRNLETMSEKAGKLYLVDLAGSEKVGKTGAEGQTLDEAKTINKSLAALGKVINALTDSNSTHVPYRDSKLTRVLQESLGGNSRTTLIINCSPSPYNEAETLSTLRFGQRAKRIKNNAKINQELSVTELKANVVRAEKEISRLSEVIAALNDELQALRGNPVSPRTSLEGSSSTASPSGVHLPNVIKLEAKAVELENACRSLEEEKSALNDIIDDLKDREQEHTVTMEKIGQQLDQLKLTEQTLVKENEILIVKLADVTIMNEKLEYQNKEHALNLEHLARQKIELEKQLDTAKTEHDTIVEALEQEKQKRMKVEEQYSRFDLSPEKRLRSVSMGDFSDSTTTASELESLSGNQAKDKPSLSSLAFDQVAKEEFLEPLKAELPDVKTGTTGAQDVDTLKQELQAMKEQMQKKNAQFESLKGSLLKDLENRVKKVVELEMFLDEAREQYQFLLTQSKTSNTKTLQQKNLTLQRNLEQMTGAVNQTTSENARLRLDLEVANKKISERELRIKQLEFSLTETQDKLQKTLGIKEDKNVIPKLSATAALTMSPTKTDKSEVTVPQDFVTMKTSNLVKPMRGGQPQQPPLKNTSSSGFLGIFGKNSKS